MHEPDSKLVLAEVSPASDGRTLAGRLSYGVNENLAPAQSYGHSTRERSDEDFIVSLAWWTLLQRKYEQDE